MIRQSLFTTLSKIVLAITFVLLIALTTFFSATAPTISVAIIISVFGVLGFAIASQMPTPAVKFERVTFYLLCTYLFFVIVWPRYAFIRLPGLPGLSPPRIIQFILVAAWITLLFKSTSFRTNLKEIFSSHTTLIILIGSLFAFKAGSVLTSSQPLLSIRGILNELISVYSLLFITASILKTKKDIHTLLSTFIAAIFLSNLLGVYESQIQRNIFLNFFEIDSNYLNDIFREKVRAGAYRIQSTFSHPLTLSECVVMAAPISFMVFSKNGLFSVRNILLYIFTFLSFFVIFKTGSRSGAGAYLFVILLSIIFNIITKMQARKNSVHAALYAISVFIIILISLFTIYAISDVMIGKTTREFNSGMARVDMWKHGFILAQQSPIFGYGQDLAATVLGFTGFGGTITIDSYYLTVLLESGFVSLITYLMIIAYITKKAIAFGFYKNENSLHVLLLLTSLLGFFLIKAILSLTHNHGIAMVLVGSLLFLMTKKELLDSNKNMSALKP